MKADIPFCPVLTPTLQEFSDFKKFVQTVQSEYKDDYGMVKIIPPAEWSSKCKNYQQKLQKLIIKYPQIQTLYGDKKEYYFYCVNTKHSQLTLEEYKKHSQDKQWLVSHIKSMEERQFQFWKRYKEIKKLVYCANIQETLMDQASGQWQINNLNSFFKDTIKQKLVGINTSFLFIGTWGTFFNWHIQDLDLSAINILHQGHPKVWYGLHPKDRKQFQQICKNLFPDKARECPNFLRHKNVLVNPYKLKQLYPNLRLTKMIQRQRQISLVFSQGFHCGFNTGYNIAEAANYGTIDWLDKFSKFRKCNCELHIGVQVEYRQTYENILKLQNIEQIKKLKSFQKLKEKAQQQIKADNLFQNADSEELENQVKALKSKKINKNKDSVYSTKYRRFLSVHKYYIQCSQCKKWITTNKQTKNKYQKIQFSCSKLNLNCKIKKQKRNQ